MKLLFEIVENQNPKIAGKEWFSGYMKRHPNLSLRHAESTPLVRASVFSEIVHKYFGVLENVLDENNITPLRSSPSVRDQV
jgi:hypothetical protein